MLFLSIARDPAQLRSLYYINFTSVRLTQNRKADGKLSFIANTPSGLPEDMEKNVRDSALYYSFFLVNTFFTFSWMFLSLTIFARVPVV
jgi:hypothetical protein